MIYLGHLSETLESLSPSKLTDLELLPSDSSLCLGATFLLLFRLFVYSLLLLLSLHYWLENHQLCAFAQQREKRREQKRRSEELCIYHREGVLALGCTRTKLLCCCCKCSTVTKRTTFYVLLCNVICTHTRARDILSTRFHLLREYHHSIISRTPRSSLPLLTR